MCVRVCAVTAACDNEVGSYAWMPVAGAATIHGGGCGSCGFFRSFMHRYMHRCVNGCMDLCGVWGSLDEVLCANVSPDARA